METKTCARCGEAKPESDWYPSTWIKSGQWCKQCYRQWHRDRYLTEVTDDSPRTCKCCGESYMPKQRRPSDFCSRSCKDAFRRSAAAAKRRASKPVDRFCLHCGVTMPQRKRADAVFCSAECNMAAHRLNRTLRRREGSGMTGWIRAEVFKRDQWRCGICRQKVNPELRYPDPMAPSLDHVVPIAEGGSHEAANLRLTHLRCNVVRRDRGGYEQLALI